MKKIFLYTSLIIITVLAACRKEDNRVFQESPDERLNKALSAYQAQLTGATNGWKAVVYPAGGGAFSFYFKFNDSNRVKMVSDFDSSSAVTLQESSYRLKALQQPSLVFDTYNYLHVLADPTGSVNGGANGSGLVSDFEFYFDSSGTDTINLVGRMNGSKAVMIKATAEEERIFTTGLFNINQFRSNYGRILEYFKRFTIGGQSYELNINVDRRVIVFNWLNASGELESYKTEFFFTPAGISLVSPFNTGTTSISELKNIEWVSASNDLTVTVGTVTGTISGAIAPLKNDVGAPKRWWEWARSSFWVWSQFGFHKNGVDDAFNVRGIAGFQRIEYRPVASGAFDAVRIINTAGGGGFGPAVTPIFTADGRVVFPNSGSQFGAVPAAAAPAYNQFRTQLFEPQGYYLVQTGFGSDEQTTYDMVNVLDAKTWITWQY